MNLEEALIAEINELKQRNRWFFDENGNLILVPASKKDYEDLIAFQTVQKAGKTNEN